MTGTRWQIRRGRGIGGDLPRDRQAGVTPIKLQGLNSRIAVNGDPCDGGAHNLWRPPGAA
ncbi:MAG: hypothetical protein ACRDHF_12700 [Tepidiformaceae bacterium]